MSKPTQIFEQSAANLELYRQWFNAVQDTYPREPGVYTRPDRFDTQRWVKQA